MSDRSDLVVDYDLLDDSAKRLKKLHTEFKGLENQQKDLQSIWGAESIRSAMGEFYGNWDHYRKELLGNIEDVGKKVSAARQGFNKTDHKLAERDTKRSGKGAS